MLRSAFLMLAIVACVSASSAQAAAITFTGTLLTKIGSGGGLNITTPQTFHGGIQVLNSGSNTSSIASGYFQFGSTRVMLSGGTVNLVPGGGNQIEFLIPTSGSSPAASISFVFTPVTDLGTGINQAQLSQTLGMTTTSFVMADNGGFPLYTGSITSVPEPGTMFALSGLVIGYGGWRLRRRKQVEA